MQQQEDKQDILVTWRGKKYTVAVTSSATLVEFGNSLQKLTDVKADTIRLIVRSNKSSKLLSPFSDEHSCLTLNETAILEGKSIMMMGAPNIEVEQVLQHAKADMRIAGFDEEEKRLRQRTISGPSTPLKLPQGNYIFSEFRTLHLPGLELNPPTSEALKLMHMLAADPGIVAIMNKHRWRVGIMTEMAPEGYVGVSPVCILGFNKNQGEEISLRLRTDDLNGFRKYQSIKKTLLHELAHMIYSDHDANFYALDKQLNQEADSLDWTRSRSHTLNGAGFSRDLDEEFYAGTNNGSSSQKLGGKGTDQLANARSSSVAAAYRRFEKAVNLSGTLEVIEEHSDDVSTYQAESVHDAEGNQNHCECDFESDTHNCTGEGNMVEPDPDDSGDREIMESEPYLEYKEGMNISEPDPDDSEMAESAPPLTTERTLIETLRHGESGPGDSEVPLIDGGFLKTQGGSHILPRGDSEVLKVDSVLVGSMKNHSQQIRDFVEPDPDDSKNGVVNAEPDPDDSIVPDQDVSRTQTDEPDPDDEVLQRIQDPVTVVCNRLQKAIKMLQSEVNPSEAVAVLQTLFKIIRNVIEHPDEIRFRKLRKANPMIQRNVANHKAAMEILLLIGFIEDVVMDEIGTRETYFILKRNDPGLLWLAKSSLETCLSY